MTAELLILGESPPGVGGDFEKHCCRRLRESLPEGFIIASNVNISRGRGNFYECDAVIIAPGFCEVVEMKCVRPEVEVREDVLIGSYGYSVDRVFSILNTKAKVLMGRLQKAPFQSSMAIQQSNVSSMVIVPNETRIRIVYESYKTNSPLRSLDEVISRYREIAPLHSGPSHSNAFRSLRIAWHAFRDSISPSERHSNHYLGRYLVRKRLPSVAPAYEYLAVDEFPCAIDVHLKEHPFDPTLSTDQLSEHLSEVSREAAILRRLRHPDIACVTGHFQTGGSWIQVSDWFESQTLEESWKSLSSISIEERISVFLRVIRALQFCHEKGIFHRNISASCIRIGKDCSEVRLGSFELARDILSTSTVSRKTLEERDQRLFAPEELSAQSYVNPRLADIFQAGVLLYRILENGEWPFESTLDYVTSASRIRPFSGDDEPGVNQLRHLAERMMSVESVSRPDICSKIEVEIEQVMRSRLSK